MVRKWIDKIEKTFAAVAFAEAGEHETAMKIAEIQPSVSTRFSDFLKSFDKYFSAITFAEADCHEMAREYLEESAIQNSRQPLEDFLETIGLQGVRVSYGFVTA